MKYRLGKLAIYLSPILLLLVLTLLPGCKPTTAANTPAVLAPGYVDSYDQQFAQIIAAAEGFYRTVQNDVNAKTYVPSPTELTALNAFGVSINVAKGAAQQYHAQQTPQTLQAAQTSTQSLKSQQQALSTQIPQGVK